ncbi:MAG: macro domain-containing protein [Planctomycetota bacterium]
MITLAHGNLLDADVEALVNTVNCVGVMGKGIALQFKKAFPDNFKAYERACKRREVRLGSMFVFATGALRNPRFLVNFPTKQDWRSKSGLEDIRAGLTALVAEIRARGIRSVAVPPLGCGHGGLQWEDVRPVIEDALAELPDVDVRLYAPGATPAPAEQRVGTKAPNMTPGRAAIVQLMVRYAAFDYRATQLEIQKLAYFLQEAGEPLRLTFKAHHYGPYADVLHKVLETMEGHFTRGFQGDRSPDTEIEVLAAGKQLADEHLAANPHTGERLERVARLIEGFETPYGLELLATVHWLVTHQPEGQRDLGGVLAGLQGWSRRKGDLFTEHHVRVALERLTSEGWISGGDSERA